MIGCHEDLLDGLMRLTDRNALEFARKIIGATIEERARMPWDGMVTSWPNHMEMQVRQDLPYGAKRRVVRTLCQIYLLHLCEGETRFKEGINLPRSLRGQF